MNKSLLLCLVLCAGCADLTAPQIDSNDRPRPQSVKAAAPAPTPAPPAPEGQPLEPQETVTASHILIAFKGAQRANPKVTRSKEEAKAEAEKLAKEASKPGANFAELAKEHTDDPTGPSRGGSLGSFTRDRMVKPFADAAFALKPGEVTSTPVETSFGFHVIKRDK